MSVHCEPSAKKRYIIERPPAPPVPPLAATSSFVPTAEIGGGIPAAVAPSTPRRPVTTRLEFSADPTQLAVLAALAPDFYAFVGQLADGCQMCSKCGAPVQPSDPVSARDHEAARCSPTSPLVIHRGLDTLHYDLKRGQIELAWYDDSIVLPCASAADADLYLATHDALMALVAQHAAPPAALHPSVQTFTLTVTGSLLTPSYSPALADFFQRAHAACSSIFSIMATPMPAAGLFSFYCSWRVVLMLDVFKISPADKAILARANRSNK